MSMRRSLRRSQMQTRLGLTNYPGTRSSRARSNSHTMMLKMASLLLILYRLGQIPLAQGQIPRNDETMETMQTWNGQESGAGTEGSVRETQNNPALTHSGIVSKDDGTVLYAQIPLQNHVNEIVFTVMSTIMCIHFPPDVSTTSEEKSV
jgi:hypothetical protein